jgi:hypothetical protein
MMGKSLKIIATITMLLIAGIWLLGCGSGDLLDESNFKYRVSMTMSDSGEDDTMSIDMVRSTDCDEDGNTTEEDDTEDPLTAAYGSITITVAPDAAGITLDSYDVEYIPVDSPDGTGGSFTPVDLQGFHGELDSLFIGSGETGVEGVLLMTIATKNEYGWVAGDPEAIYSIKVTLHCIDEGGEDRDIEVFKDVLLFDVWRCS